MTDQLIEVTEQRHEGEIVVETCESVEDAITYIMDGYDASEKEFYLPAIRIDGTYDHGY